LSLSIYSIRISVFREEGIENNVYGWCTSNITSEVLEDWQNEQILPVGEKSFGASVGTCAPGSFPDLSSRIFCLLGSLSRPSVSEAELSDLNCPIFSFKFPFPVLALFKEEFPSLSGGNG